MRGMFTSQMIIAVPEVLAKVANPSMPSVASTVSNPASLRTNDT